MPLFFPIEHCGYILLSLLLLSIVNQISWLPWTPPFWYFIGLFNVCVVYPRTLIPRDLYIELYNRFEIWGTHRQQCCRGTCQISKRCYSLNYQSRDFETSRDLTVGRLIRYQKGALVTMGYDYLYWDLLVLNLHLLCIDMFLMKYAYCLWFTMFCCVSLMVPLVTFRITVKCLI